MKNLIQNNHERMDALETAMADMPIDIECPVHHEFRDGYYERTVLLPLGPDGEPVLVAGKIHKTRHEYVVSRGVLGVKGDDGKWYLIRAPYHGWTEPGKRRLAIVLEPTVWTTFHKLEPGETTPEQVEDRIIEKHDHPYIRIKKERGQLT